MSKKTTYTSIYKKSLCGVCEYVCLMSKGPSRSIVYVKTLLSWSGISLCFCPVSPFTAQPGEGLPETATWTGQ